MTSSIQFIGGKPIELNRRQIVKGLAAGYIVAVGGCVQNQALGRQQLLLVSEAQMTQLSASAWTQIRKEQKVSTNRTLNRRLQTVGPKIVNAAGLQNQPWEYTVFKGDEANAFVLPGGKVGFYEGIFKRMENDDQLATVMGHETGHVAARHSAERYSQQMAAGVGMQAAQVALQSGDVSGAGAIAAVLGAGVQFGVLLPYSRTHELEADRLGLNYMAKAGYDPRQSLRFWQNMTAQRGSKAPPPEFMSTHPSDQTRIASLTQQLRQMGYQV
ncbi:M48 family metallopeptidase [Parvibaculum sp.]|uniref:M48 family metallopeptidase n=3 Tax=Parvibaculum sp. TaxID=2024848 RepID=UPI001AFE7B13|nr:M48 family metallopeptidase [Parvibaculum sp.]MBO6634543.1 M48 family metallopeptidase [Parvibaculum sp.]MBO6679685.1 M48 family metallopeptidase [Parvibaculum sp.]